MSDVVIDYRPSGTLVVRPQGRLDAELGTVMLRAVTNALSVLGAARVIVDLAAVRSYTEGSMLSLTGCRRLAQHLPGRLALVTGPGAGAAALRRSAAIAP